MEGAQGDVLAGTPEPQDQGQVRECGRGERGQQPGGGFVERKGRHQKRRYRLAQQDRDDAWGP